jgi:hypothetical protein
MSEQSLVLVQPLLGCGAGAALYQDVTDMAEYGFNPATFRNEKTRLPSFKIPKGERLVADCSRKLAEFYEKYPDLSPSIHMIWDGKSEFQYVSVLFLFLQGY